MPPPIRLPSLAPSYYLYHFPYLFYILSPFFFFNWHSLPVTKPPFFLPFYYVNSSFSFLFVSFRLLLYCPLFCPCILSFYFLLSLLYVSSTAFASFIISLLFLLSSLLIIIIFPPSSVSSFVLPLSPSVSLLDHLLSILCLFIFSHSFAFFRHVQFIFFTSHYLSLMYFIFCLTCLLYPFPLSITILPLLTLTFFPLYPYLPPFTFPFFYISPLPSFSCSIFSIFNDCNTFSSSCFSFLPSLSPLSLEFLLYHLSIISISPNCSSFLFYFHIFFIHCLPPYRFIFISSSSTSFIHPPSFQLAQTKHFVICTYP